jgi:hypothetical protein
MSPSQPEPPARYVASLVNELSHAIAWRRDAGLLAGPMAVLLWAWLHHLRDRLLCLAGRIAAGRGSGVPRRKLMPIGPETPARAALPARPKPRRAPQRLLPNQHAGWLIRLVPEAAIGCSRLQHLFADPDMVALAATAPQLGRLLRPLCRGVGIALPDYLKPPASPPGPSPRTPRPARAPRPRTPRPPASIAAQMRVAWPGLRRPYRLHGLIPNPRGKPPDPPDHLARLKLA